MFVLISDNVPPKAPRINNKQNEHQRNSKRNAILKIKNKTQISRYVNEKKVRRKMSNKYVQKTENPSFLFYTKVFLLKILFE